MDGSTPVGRAGLADRLLGLPRAALFLFGGAALVVLGGAAALGSAATTGGPDGLTVLAGLCATTGCGLLAGGLVLVGATALGVGE
jgi:hypothetical protein